MLEELQKHNAELLKQEQNIKDKQENAIHGYKIQASNESAEIHNDVLARKSKAIKESEKRLTYMKEFEKKVADTLALEEEQKQNQEANIANELSLKKSMQRENAFEMQNLEEILNLEYKATGKMAELLKFRQAKEDDKMQKIEQSLQNSNEELKERQIEEISRTEENMRLLQESQDQIIQKDKSLSQAEIEREKTVQRMTENQRKLLEDQRKSISQKVSKNTEEEKTPISNRVTMKIIQKEEKKEVPTQEQPTSSGGFNTNPKFATFKNTNVPMESTYDATKKVNSIPAPEQKSPSLGSESDIKSEEKKLEERHTIARQEIMEINKRLEIDKGEQENEDKVSPGSSPISESMSSSDQIKSPSKDNGSSGMESELSSESPESSKNNNDINNR